MPEIGRSFCFPVAQVMAVILIVIMDVPGRRDGSAKNEPSTELGTAFCRNVGRYIAFHAGRDHRGDSTAIRFYPADLVHPITAKRSHQAGRSNYPVLEMISTP